MNVGTSSSSGPSSGPSSGSNVFELLLQLAGAGGVVYAFVYYIGDAYTTEYYKSFGFDVDLVAPSPTDLLKSGVSVLMSAVFSVVAVLFAIVSASVVSKQLSDPARSAESRRNIALSWTAVTVVVSLVLFILGIFASGNSSQLAFATIAGLAIAIAGVAAKNRFVTPSLHALIGRASELTLLIVVILLMLATSVLAGSTYATSVARSDADRLSRSFLTELPRVAIYAQQQVPLGEAKVEFRSLQGVDGAPSLLYKYEYRDLYLLKKSEKRWFLLAGSWNSDSSQGVIMLDDVTTIRVVFVGRN